MDKLVYFDAKGLGEAIRQLYVLSGTEFCDERIDFEEFKKRKAGKHHLVIHYQYSISWFRNW